MRIACAECHHHPFDRWSQTDYFGMTAFFAPAAAQEHRRCGEMLFASGDPATKHPRTGEHDHRPSRWASRCRRRTPPGDRRVRAGRLARRRPTIRGSPATWPTASGPTCSAAAWSSRSTTSAPPTRRAIPNCSTRLAKHLVEHKFDLRALIRTIAASRTYQHSRRTQRDQRNATSRTTRGACSSGSMPRCCSTRCARRPASARNSTACPPARGRSSCGTARCDTISCVCSAGRTRQTRLRVRAQSASRASPRCCTC